MSHLNGNSNPFVKQRAVKFWPGLNDLIKKGEASIRESEKVNNYATNGVENFFPGLTELVAADNASSMNNGASSIEKKPIPTEKIYLKTNRLLMNLQVRTELGAWKTGQCTTKTIGPASTTLRLLTTLQIQATDLRAWEVGLFPIRK